MPTAAQARAYVDGIRRLVAEGKATEKDLYDAIESQKRVDASEALLFKKTADELPGTSGEAVAQMIGGLPKAAVENADLLTGVAMGGLTGGLYLGAAPLIGRPARAVAGAAWDALGGSPLAPPEPGTKSEALTNLGYAFAPGIPGIAGQAARIGLGLHAGLGMGEAAGQTQQAFQEFTGQPLSTPQALITNLSGVPNPVLPTTDPFTTTIHAKMLQDMLKAGREVYNRPPAETETVAEAPPPEASALPPFPEVPHVVGRPEPTKPVEAPASAPEPAKLAGTWEGVKTDLQQFSRKAEPGDIFELENGTRLVVTLEKGTKYPKVRPVVPGYQPSEAARKAKRVRVSDPNDPKAPLLEGEEVWISGKNGRGYSALYIGEGGVARDARTQGPEASRSMSFISADGTVRTAQAGHIYRTGAEVAPEVLEKLRTRALEAKAVATEWGMIRESLRGVKKPADVVRAEPVKAPGEMLTPAEAAMMTSEPPYDGDKPPTPAKRPPLSFKSDPKLRQVFPGERAPEEGEGKARVVEATSPGGEVREPGIEQLDQNEILQRDAVAEAIKDMKDAYETGPGNVPVGGAKDMLSEVNGLLKKARAAAARVGTVRDANAAIEAAKADARTYGRMARGGAESPAEATAAKATREKIVASIPGLEAKRDKAVSALKVVNDLIKQKKTIEDAKTAEVLPRVTEEHAKALEEKTAARREQETLDIEAENARMDIQGAKRGDPTALSPEDIVLGREKESPVARAGEVVGKKAASGDPEAMGHIEKAVEQVAKGGDTKEAGQTFLHRALIGAGSGVGELVKAMSAPVRESFKANFPETMKVIEAFGGKKGRLPRNQRQGAIGEYGQLVLEVAGAVVVDIVNAFKETGKSVLDAFAGKPATMKDFNEKIRKASPGRISKAMEAVTESLVSFARFARREIYSSPLDAIFNHIVENKGKLEKGGYFDANGKRLKSRFQFANDIMEEMKTVLATAEKEKNQAYQAIAKSKSFHDLKDGTFLQDAPAYAINRVMEAIVGGKSVDEALTKIKGWYGKEFSALDEKVIRETHETLTELAKLGAMGGKNATGLVPKAWFEAKDLDGATPDEMFLIAASLRRSLGAVMSSSSHLQAEALAEQNPRFRKMLEKAQEELDMFRSGRLAAAEEAGLDFLTDQKILDKVRDDCLSAVDYQLQQSFAGFFPAQSPFFAKDGRGTNAVLTAMQESYGSESFTKNIQAIYTRAAELIEHGKVFQSIQDNITGPKAKLSFDVETIGDKVRHKRVYDIVSESNFENMRTAMREAAGLFSGKSTTGPSGLAKVVDAVFGTSMSDISHSNAATFAFIRRSLFGNLLGNPVFMGVNTSDAFVKSDAPIPAKMLVGKYILHALGKLGKGMLGKSSEIENKMFREWDQFAKNEGIADANVMSEMQGVGVPWKAGDKGYIPQFIQKVAGGKGYEALGKLTSLFPRGVEQQEQINNRAIFLLSLEKELIKDRAAFKKVFKVNKFALEQLRELEADNPEAFKAAKDAARIETAKLQNVGNWIGSNSASGMALKHALGRDSYGWNMLSLSTMFYGYPVNMMRQVVDRIAKQGPDTTIPKIAAPLLTPMLWAAGLYTLGNAAASLSAGGNPEEEATVAKAVARGVKELGMPAMPVWMQLARTVLYGGAKAVAKGEVPWTALETAAGAAIPGFNAIRKPIKFLASKSQG